MPYRLIRLLGSVIYVEGCIVSRLTKPKVLLANANTISWRMNNLSITLGYDVCGPKFTNINECIDNAILYENTKATRHFLPSSWYIVNNNNGISKHIIIENGNKGYNSISDIIRFRDSIVNKGEYKMNGMKSYNEVTGGMPPAHCHTDYIVPVLMSGPTFTDRSNMLFGNTGSDKMIRFNSMMEPEIIDKEDVLEAISDCYRLIMPSNILVNPNTMTKKKLKALGEDGLIELMINRPYTGWKDLILEKVIHVSDDIDNDFVRELKLNGLVQNSIMALNESVMTESFVNSVGHVTILKDGEGYYAETPKDYYLVSKHYESYNDIPDNIVKMMDNMYKAYSKKEGLLYASDSSQE